MDEPNVFNQFVTETISRTDEGQPRPKYIFNKCGPNIYFFTLQRFGPLPSPNFKRKKESFGFFSKQNHLKYYIKTYLRQNFKFDLEIIISVQTGTGKVDQARKFKCTTRLQQGCRGQTLCFIKVVFTFTKWAKVRAI